MTRIHLERQKIKPAAMPNRQFLNNLNVRYILIQVSKSRRYAMRLRQQIG
jgi:hypothetical protein